MKWVKGYIDEDFVFMLEEVVEEEAKRSVWALLRAQEHCVVAFVLDDTVPFDEAWADDLTATLPRWRAHPAAIGAWLNQGEIDWRPTCLTPEDFYAA
jgi:hypothetical protein